MMSEEVTLVGAGVAVTTTTRSVGVAGTGVDVTTSTVEFCDKNGIGRHAMIRSAQPNSSQKLIRRRISIFLLSRGVGLEIFKIISNAFSADNNVFSHNQFDTCL